MKNTTPTQDVWSRHASVCMQTVRVASRDVNAILDLLYGGDSIYAHSTSTSVTVISLHSSQQACIFKSNGWNVPY